MVSREQELVVVTGSDKNYKKIVEKNKENCEKFGHTFVAYDLGGLGFGIKKEVDKEDLSKENKLITCIFKPSVILDSLKRYKYVMWVDGDAYVNREINFPFDFDIGVTTRVRKHKDPELWFINAGVVMFKNSPKVYRFVEEWSQYKDGSDQGYLNKQISPFINHEDNIPLHGKIKAQGLDVRVFPAARYNDYYNLKEDSYVHHFKGWGHIASREICKAKKNNREYIHIVGINGKLMKIII